MTEIVKGAESELSQSHQDNFYESSVRWVMSLKERHDPLNLMGVLENDIEKYPFQDIRRAYIPPYEPSGEELEEMGKTEIQEQVLAQLKLAGGIILGGEQNFENFVADIVGRQAKPVKEEEDILALETLYKRTKVPNNNSANLIYHPNVMALPLFSAGTALALSRAEFADDFDLFEFSQSNLILINPALAVASFGGEPVMPFISQFATQIKVTPPTVSALQYGLDRQVRKVMTRQSSAELDRYLEALTARNRSSIVTVDPTASTFNEVQDEHSKPALERKPVNRMVQSLVINKFSLVWPMTMILEGKNSKWYLGDLESVRGDDNGKQFEKIIKELDRQTELLSGKKMTVADNRRLVGRAALS